MASVPNVYKELKVSTSDGVIVSCAAVCIVRFRCHQKYPLNEMIKSGVWAWMWLQLCWPHLGYELTPALKKEVKHVLDPCLSS